MTQDRFAEVEALLALTDALWMEEIAKAFGAGRVDAVAASLDGRGEPGTPLRQAFEARERASAAWRAARGGQTSPVRV